MLIPAISIFTMTNYHGNTRYFLEFQKNDKNVVMDIEHDVALHHDLMMKI